MPYTPVITQTTPGLQASMVGALSYNEFVNILGTQQFKVKRLFIEALSNKQVMQPMIYNFRNANGIITAEVLKPKIDPFQKQPAMWYNTNNKDIVLDGLSSLGVDLLPGEQVTLILVSDMVSFQLSQASGKKDINSVGIYEENYEAFISILA